MRVNLKYLRFRLRSSLSVISIQQISANLPNGNSVTNSHLIAIQPITLKLKRKRNLNYSKCTTEVLVATRSSVNENKILG